MVRKPGKHQRSKQRGQDLGWKVHDRAHLLFCAHTLCMNYVMKYKIKLSKVAFQLTHFCKQILEWFASQQKFYLPIEEQCKEELNRCLQVFYASVRQKKWKRIQSFFAASDTRYICQLSSRGVTSFYHC